MWDNGADVIGWAVVVVRSVVRHNCGRLPRTAESHMPPFQAPHEVWLFMPCSRPHGINVFFIHHIFRSETHVSANTLPADVCSCVGVGDRLSEPLSACFELNPEPC